MAFTVIFEETCNAANSFTQIVLVRQENKAEVVRMRPVEACPLNQKHFFFLQQFGNELLVVLDRINSRIELREHVQRRFGLHAAHGGVRLHQREERVELVGLDVDEEEGRGSRDKVTYRGTWAATGDALTLQLPKPDTGDDQIPCRLAVDKDEDVLRCQVDEELAFEARPSRR